MSNDEEKEAKMQGQKGVEAALRAMQDAFIASQAKSADLKIQFDLHGDFNGRVWLHVQASSLQIGWGDLDMPTATLSMTSQDFIDVAFGRLHAMVAFMQGRMLIAGNSVAAASLPRYFSFGK